ncbi:MAG TPA: winged helix-turn-helix domain-containing protein [Micrococcaceae bacterium]|jgi:predicted ArsR family transcriptional regulator
MDGDGSDETVLARGRALSSPLRMRILRICLHRGRTNKEIADALGLNPASTLHHVRTLVRTGFLLPQEPRAGKRGAKEIPYLASKLSLHTPVPNVASVLISTFLQEIEDLAPADIDVSRLGVKFNAEHQREMLDRFNALVEEYAQRPADDDGVPTSILFAHHLDRSASDEPTTGS